MGCGQFKRSIESKPTPVGETLRGSGRLPSEHLSCAGTSWFRVFKHALHLWKYHGWETGDPVHPVWTMDWDTPEKAEVLRRMYSPILEPPHADLAGYICAGTASGGRLKD